MCNIQCFNVLTMLWSIKIISLHSFCNVLTRGDLVNSSASFNQYKVSDASFLLI